MVVLDVFLPVPNSISFNLGCQIDSLTRATLDNLVLGLSLSMGWFSPPDRREITLLLFCLVVYLLAYNIEISLHLLGVDSVATSGALFSRIGLGKTRALARDGRKPNGWRDALELQIFGDWIWDQGHIAGDSDQQAQKIGTDHQYGAAWASKAQVRQMADDVLGDLSVNQALQQWRDSPPQTKVLKHVPGTCILAAALLK